ncbi:MAG: lysylphosphatidylglycerol synthase domain-containing protein, partial [Trueperaceae bacterium]
RRAAAPWLGLALAIGAIVVLIRARGEDLAVLTRIDPWAVALLVGAQLLYLVVQSGRFHVVLLRLGDRTVGFGPWLRLFVLGRFLNLFVPQSGNVYRAVELKRRFGLSYVSFVAAFLNAPWIAMVLTFALGAVTIRIVDAGAPVGPVPLWAALVVAAGATASAPLIAAVILPWMPRRWRAVAWAHDRLRDMLRLTLDSLRDGAYLLRVTAWTTAAFVQAVAMLWVAFAGLATGMGGGAVDGVGISALIRVTGVVALVTASLPLGGAEALRMARADAAQRAASTPHEATGS